MQTLELETMRCELDQELLSIPFTALKHTKLQIDRSFDQNFKTRMVEMVDAEEDCLRSPEHKAAMLDYHEELTRKDN